MVQDASKEFYVQICDDVFKEYSNHSIMRYSLELVYSFIVNFSDKPDPNIQEFINTKSFHNMKYELKTLKFVHFIFYLAILYVFVIIGPKLFMNLFLYFVDKLLYLFFIVLIIEGVANLYMDLNIDIVSTTRNLFSFLPINFAGQFIIDLVKTFIGTFIGEK